MKNFESLRLSLLENKKDLVTDFDFNKLRRFTKEFKSLYEALIFDLLSSSDDFFGNVMVNIARKYNYCLPTAMNHQVTGMTAVIHINPLLFVNYTKEEMKELIIHEIYHVIGQHAKRTEPFLGSTSPKLLVLASDLVACQSMELINSKRWWTYSKLVSEFGIILEKDNTVEENIKTLKSLLTVNEKFAEYIGPWERNEFRDKDFSEYSEEELEGIMEDEDYDFFNEDHEEDIETEFFITTSDETDLELMDDFIRTIINQSASNSRGLLPNGVKQILDELNGEPKIAWQRILMKRLGSLPVPYKKTIVRNSRRMPERLELKGRISDRVCKLYVFIDTSGSVSDQEIEYILNEITAINKVYKGKVIVIECDCQVQRVYELKDRDKAKRDIEGRGGTAFTPALEYAMNEKGMSKDSVAIYFTDGGGETEIPKLPNPMIWVLTRKDNLSVRNPQGRILRLEDDTKFTKTFNK